MSTPLTMDSVPCAGPRRRIFDRVEGTARAWPAGLRDDFFTGDELRGADLSSEWVATGGVRAMHAGYGFSYAVGGDLR